MSKAIIGCVAIALSATSASAATLTKTFTFVGEGEFKFDLFDPKLGTPNGNNAIYQSITLPYELTANNPGEAGEGQYNISQSVSTRIGNQTFLGSISTDRNVTFEAGQNEFKSSIFGGISSFDPFYRPVFHETYEFRLTDTPFVTAFVYPFNFLRTDASYGTPTVQLRLEIGYTPAAVPEPATWAMMIGGIGMAGGAMRRQRRVKVSYA